jgi:choline dehydrogenase
VEFQEQYDFVIVGAGSSGCVLANRLTQDPSVRVLLLEAGPPDRNPWLHIPAGVPKVVNNPDITWGYSTEPEPGLNGRRLAWPRGRTLGGSSSINGHVYMRGTWRDYDGWRDLGNPGWGWSDVLPYFKRSEGHYRGDSALHGGQGELGISPVHNPHPASEAFIQSAMALGIPRTEDFNGPQQDGVGYLDLMVRGGQRSSTAVGFLRPVMGRSNLQVRTGALVERVVMEGRQARGVQFSIAGRRQQVGAGEVVLCGGAINSPQLLMLSGIGPGTALSALGIAVVHDLAGVGQNLHDHVYAHCLARVEAGYSLNPKISRNWKMIPDVLEYAFKRTGLLTSAAAQVGLFVRTRDGLQTPDMQLQMRPFSMISKGGMYSAEPTPAITASCAILQPHSRGQLTLRSADPREAPRMVANYLTDPRDLPTLLAGIRLIRRIFATKPFADFYQAEDLPGPGLTSDDALVAFLRDNAQSMYHPVGTCRMGPSAEDGAVVDARLRVHGIGGLRVVDASIMPVVPSGNTNAPAIMVAEKAADMIREDARVAQLAGS